MKCPECDGNLLNCELCKGSGCVNYPGATEEKK